MPLKEELARAVRADIRSGKMTVLKSRFVQPMIGLYIVLNIGVVWCESEHRHYYIMMQIKCDQSKPVDVAFMSKFVVFDN